MELVLFSPPKEHRFSLDIFLSPCLALKWSTIINEFLGKFWNAQIYIFQGVQWIKHKNVFQWPSYKVRFFTLTRYTLFVAWMKSLFESIVIYEWKMLRHFLEIYISYRFPKTLNKYSLCLTKTTKTTKLIHFNNI